MQISIDANPQDKRLVRKSKLQATYMSARRARSHTLQQYYTRAYGVLTSMHSDTVFVNSIGDRAQYSGNANGMMIQMWDAEEKQGDLSNDMTAKYNPDSDNNNSNAPHAKSPEEDSPQRSVSPMLGRLPGVVLEWRRPHDLLDIVIFAMVQLIKVNTLVLLLKGPSQVVSKETGYSCSSYLRVHQIVVPLDEQ